MKKAFRGGRIKSTKKMVQRTALFFCVFVLSITLFEPGVTYALQTNPPEKKFNTDYEIDPLKSADQAKPTPGLQESAGEPTAPKMRNPRGKKYEDTSKRTAHGSIYVNNDGTRTYEYSVRQQNYKNGDKWEKINNDLTAVVPPLADPSIWQTITNTAPEAESPEEFKGKVGRMAVHMMPLAKGISMSLDDKTIVMKPDGSKNVKPVKKNDTATVYKDAWKGINLEYQAFGELVKENIVIKQKDVAAEYEFKVTGAKLIDDKNSPGYFTVEGVEDGYRFGGLTLALMDRGPIEIPESSITQERTDDNSIKIKIDKAWLSSLPESSFPLTIDPSFGRWDTDANDLMIKSNGYSCNGSSCWIQAGTLYDAGWKHWRSYLHIPYPELAGGKKSLMPIFTPTTTRMRARILTSDICTSATLTALAGSAGVSIWLRCSLPVTSTSM